MKPLTRNAVLAIAFLLAPAAHAVDFLYTASTTFFEEIPGQRYGIEVEVVNISQDQAALSLQKSLGGKLQRIDNKTVELRGSSLGRLQIKVELNETSDDPTIDWSKNKNQVIEVVTDPIEYKSTAALDVALESLKKAGARGTEGKNPISIQINYGIDQKVSQDVQAEDLISVLRNYLSPAHQKQIKAALQVPDARWPYLRDYSEGFMKKLYDPKYAPNAQELMFDFFYRQSLELSRPKGPSPWKMTPEEVRRQIQELKYPVHVQVIKLNQIKIASLLAYWFPNDPYTKAILKQGWIKAAPLIEYRNANSDFKVAEKARQATGIFLSSKKYGFYDHDTLMSKLSNVAKVDIKILREKSQTYKDGTYGYRYFPEEHGFQDPSFYHQEEVWPLYDAHPNLELGYMPPMVVGQKALQLPGESVVWHRQQLHATNILGKYNPALPNRLLTHMMENKWFEYIVWQELAPGLLIETQLLSSMDHSSPEATLKSLNEAFPEGWILKGSWDWATEKNGMISSMTDPRQLHNPKALADFVAFKAETERTLTSVDPEEMLWVLKQHKGNGYIPWKFQELLKKPQFVLVQPLVEIKKEFRVEVVGGKALSKGTTVDRYFYQKDDQDGRASKKEARLVENFANAAVARLPKALQGMPMAMDVALLKNGQLTIIETNPTGNGGLIAFKPGSVEVMNDYLTNIRKEQDPSAFELTEAQQMSFARFLFQKYGIDPAEQFPTFHFTENGLTDDRYRTTPEPAYNANLGIKQCEKIFAN